MKNPIKKLFQVTFDPTRRSWKDLDHKVDFTASTGWLIPFDVQEVLPGDHWECDPMIYVQTNPLQTPLLSSFTCTVDAFFIPTRLYVQTLDQNNMSLAFDAETPFPYINLPGSRFNDGWPLQTNIEETALANRSTSLISFLGMCPPTDFERFATDNASGSIRINAIPLVGYYDIFRNVYANIHDTSGVPYRVGIGRDSSNMGQLIDHLVPLKLFDNFINLVTLKSLDISKTGDIQPAAVNAGACWREAAGGSIYLPWFANGRCRWDADSHDVNHLGLLRATYADDYFTAYFKNSYVTAAEDTAIVNVKNNKFSVYQLRFQNRIARFVDRNLLSNFRYGGYLNVHFGVSAPKDICKPIYLGRKRCKLTFNEVISATEGNAESVGDNKSLGSRASLGSGFTDHNKRNMFELDSSEYGYIMHIFCIRPEVSYYQGIPKMYMKTQLSHLYVPEFDGYGYQDLSMLELIATKPYFEYGIGNTTWPAQNTAIAQHPAFIEYMTTVDSVKGLFMDDTYYKNWFLVRRFDELPYYGVDPMSVAGSTYIYPEAYDYIFPVQKELDNFQVHVKFRMRVKRPMSAQILPSL